MRIAIFIKKAKSNHRIVAPDLAFDIDDLVVVKMFFEFFLQNVKGIGKINFQWTGVVSRGLHVSRDPLSVKVKEFKPLFCHPLIVMNDSSSDLSHPVMIFS